MSRDYTENKSLIINTYRNVQVFKVSAYHSSSIVTSSFTDSLYHISTDIVSIGVGRSGIV